MSQNPLDDARKKLASIRKSFEDTRLALELAPEIDDPEYTRAKEDALKQLQGASESVELLAAKMGITASAYVH